MTPLPAIGRQVGIERIKGVKGGIESFEVSGGGGWRMKVTER